ncbi:Plug domain-containing protein [Candidatus Williamhamiltonella defendens]|uniref:Plug domain-containing protein n=1 Tax=Candidatus Williamhamiltonella defendens TaxID=138072 RepID=UPI00130E8458|nr:Plug domain-containing protein [Candidatus Hamiltonella defensa]
MTIDDLAQSSFTSETVSRKIINKEKEERIIVQEYSFDETKGLISGGKGTSCEYRLIRQQDSMDTLFSVSNYTFKYMEESQAITLWDAINQDPSVRLTRQEGRLLDSFSLQGFPSNESWRFSCLFEYSGLLNRFIRKSLSLVSYSSTYFSI